MIYTGVREDTPCVFIFASRRWKNRRLWVYGATSSAWNPVITINRRVSSSRDYRSDLLLVDWDNLVGRRFLFIRLRSAAASYYLLLVVRPSVLCLRRGLG